MKLRELLRHTRDKYIALPDKDTLEHLKLFDAVELMLWAIYPSAKWGRFSPEEWADEQRRRNETIEFLSEQFRDTNPDEIAEYQNKNCGNRSWYPGFNPNQSADEYLLLKQLEAEANLPCIQFTSPSILRKYCEEPEIGGIVYTKPEYYLLTVKKHFLDGKAQLVSPNALSINLKPVADEYKDMPLKEFGNLRISVDEFSRYVKQEYGITVVIAPEFYPNEFYDVSKDVRFLSVWELSKLLVESKGETPDRGSIITEARNWIARKELSSLTEWDMKPDALHGITNSTPFEEATEALANAHYIRMDSALILCDKLGIPRELLRQKMFENLGLFERQNTEQDGNGLDKEVLSDAAGDSGAGSQGLEVPTSTKIAQANTNDTEYSGLLKAPDRKNAWFDVIDDMTRSFYSQNNFMPNEAQAWAQLCDSPPLGYGITKDKERGEECIKMSGVKPLSKSAFTKRWKKYTANKPQ